MRVWLKELRKEKNFTMKELGEQLGISESYYCAIENGSRKDQLSLGMVTKLSEVLGVSIDTIAEYEKNRMEGVAV